MLHGLSGHLCCNFAGRHPGGPGGIGLFSDQELVSKAAGLREEQDKWNDLFATKLIELLDKIDSIQAGAKTELASAADQRLSLEELERCRDFLPSLQGRLVTLQNSLEEEQKKIREEHSRMEAMLASAQRNEAAAVTARNCLDGAVSRLKIADEKIIDAARRLNEAEVIQKKAASEREIAVDRLHTAEMEKRRAESAYSQASQHYREAIKLLNGVVTLSYSLTSIVFFVALLVFVFWRWIHAGHAGWLVALPVLLIAASVFWFVRVRATVGRTLAH